MQRNTYTHQRSNTDRRRANIESCSSNGDTDKLFNMILNRLDEASSNTPEDTHQGDQLTFTVPQILTGLVAAITIGGSLLAAWVNLNNQITSQKVSTDIIIAQIQKDISILGTTNKETNNKIDSVIANLQTSIDKLSNRVEDLDNTVGQLYSRNTLKK